MTDIDDDRRAARMENLDIRAAKMRLREAGEKFNEIRASRKTPEEKRAAISQLYEQCYTDRQFLTRKGITRWPTKPARSAPSMGDLPT